MDPATNKAETNQQLESPAKSFRERAAERLKSETEREAPTDSDDLQDDETIQDDEDASEDVRQSGEDESEEQDDLSTDDEDSDEAVTDDDADPDDDIETWRTKAEEAEKARSQMERDYRIKTHKISQATRELKDLTENTENLAGFFQNLSQGHMAQFSQVNWDHLRQDPEQYNAVRAQYQQALAQTQQIEGAVKKLRAHNKSAMEKARSREAEVSRDILKSTFSDWNNDTYADLREFAVKDLSYTQEEFDDISDWRRIRDIKAQHQMAQAPKTLAKVRKKGKRKSAQRERAKVKTRDALGKFKQAQANAKPGDRQGFRERMKLKLEAERGR